MNLLNKFKSKGFNVVCTTPSIVCTTFEDNTSAIEIVNVSKMRAHDKHTRLVYNYFREHVIQKYIVIKPIDTLFQMTNIFTKPLCSELCLRHHTEILHF